MRHLYTLTIALTLLGSLTRPVLAQQVLMQGWYWDYPKTAGGYSWADTLRLKAARLAQSGFTHVWFPPHAVASFGTASNGYDPKDLFIGNQTTGLGTRPNLNAMLAEFTAQGITPVADMIYNHRDGGQAEVNPPVKNYVTNLYNAQNGSNPFPSDRFRYALPIGGSTGNGAGGYYVKVSSKSMGSQFNGKAYQAVFWTNKTGLNPGTAISVPAGRGGGDCGQPSQPVLLNQPANAAVVAQAGQCGTVEFNINLAASDFNPTDTLFFSLINPNGNYSDHRPYGLWNGSADVVGQVLYQTYTNFVNMPSAPTGTISIGGQAVNVNGTYADFKPNVNNPAAGGLTGDFDSFQFFYDYDQSQTSTINLLNNWTLWNYETLGVRGLRMDAVKAFPPAFVSQLLNKLHSTGRVPNFVVGEHWSSSSEISAWLTAVKGGMTPAAQAAIQPKAFDFPLRYALRDACDNGSYDVRNVFTSSLHDAAGVSGFNAVTFVNNHDFRDNSGPGAPVNNDPILAYAYILTNNQLGVPTVFYPDYYGYPAPNPTTGQYGYHPTSLSPLKTPIDRLIQTQKQYILNAPSVEYLNRFGSPRSSNYISGSAGKCLIYQLEGSATNGNRDVIVAINFGTTTLKVDQQINTRSGVIATGTQFSDVLGQSAFPFAVISGSGQVYLGLPPRSYSVWVQGIAPVLPVDLIDFSAKPTGRRIRLDWRSAREVKFDRYDIQRSTDAREFITIGQQRGQGETGGTYQFTDEHPVIGQTRYYRLRLVDTDGSARFSKIQSARIEPDALGLTVGPNPAHDTVQLRIDSPIEQPVPVRVVNQAGQLLRTLSVAVQPGQTSINLTLTGLATGRYLIQIGQPGKTVSAPLLID